MLDFDAETLTSALRTVYTHWTVVEGKFVMLDYTSSDGSGRTARNRASVERDLEKTKTISVDYESETAKSRWAVIVAASYGWANYRHQADALYLYHLLKNLKEPKDRYDDDHIILILADDIATGWRNKKPGEIYARLNGENLYTNDVQIDYLLSELTSDDMVKIMKGETIDVTTRSTDKELHPKLVETLTAMSDSENKRF